MRDQEYRSKAAGCLLAATTTSDPKIRDELYALALINLRLAELAKRNSLTNLVHELPPPPAASAGPESGNGG